jgi:hypothetical protein
MIIEIRGASDDLIEIDGALSEEFSVSGESVLLGVSDGTLLTVSFDVSGVWRINLLVEGSAEYSKVDGTEKSGTDVVKLEAPSLTWVLLGDQRA